HLFGRTSTLYSLSLHDALPILRKALEQRLDGIELQVKDLRALMPEISERLNQRLRERLADLAQPVEPGRLEQELVLQLTRADVRSEEHTSELQSRFDLVCRLLL